MIKQLFRDIVWKMYCLYRFLVTTVFVGNLIFLPVLLCAPSVIYVHTEPIILSSCSNKSAFAAAPLYQPGMVDSFCFQQRRALFLFAVFNVVRILSFKFESMWLRSFKTCGVRQLLPGKYLNGALAVPFVTRELCEPYVHGYGAHFIFMFTNGVCSLLLIAPYIRDLIALIKLTLNGTGNEFYKTKAHLLLTVLAIICFLLTLIANVIDIAFGPYCPTTILGYSVLFPHLNFPLFLFALHHFILRTHKEHGRDIYEVLEEDIYVYVIRYQCLNSEDCPRRSSVYTIALRPSLAARNSGLALNGKVRQVESLRDLDAWLQEKMRMAVPPPEEKNIYY